MHDFCYLEPLAALLVQLQLQQVNELDQVCLCSVPSLLAMVRPREAELLAAAAQQGEAVQSFMESQEMGVARLCEAAAEQEP